MNPLQNWENAHFKKILEELKQANIDLSIPNIPLIIQETSFAVRSKKYPEQCPYYRKTHSCHPEVQDLNCFLCACPYYKSDSLEGGCEINSNSGKWHSPYPYSSSNKVWDCSDCSIPHSPEFVEKWLRQNLDKLKQRFD